MLPHDWRVPPTCAIGGDSDGGLRVVVDKSGCGLRVLPHDWRVPPTCVIGGDSDGGLEWWWIRVVVG